MVFRMSTKNPHHARPAREPGELATVQEFINTKNLQGADELTGPEALERWLSGHRLLKEKTRTSEADVRHAVEVREALRDLLAANDGDRVPKDAVETLGRAARSAQLVMKFASDGQAELEPATPGVDAAMGHILAIAFHAMIAGSWLRLKACRDETCRWAFFDRSKNRSGSWCSMAVCGNRSKARKHRHHLHAAS